MKDISEVFPEKITLCLLEKLHNKASHFGAKGVSVSNSFLPFQYLYTLDFKLVGKGNPPSCIYDNVVCCAVNM